MGLDMYLTASVYVGGWEHAEPAERERYRAAVQLADLGLGDAPCPASPSVVLDVTVAYWRKANAIHRWFVQNVQGGRDECQESDVSIEQLGQLVALCKQVLDSVECVDGAVHVGTTFHPDGRVVEETIPGQVVAQPGLAASLLPTQSGFFFGKTDYDQHYLEDLRDTVRQLEPLLADGMRKRASFTYRASW